MIGHFCGTNILTWILITVLLRLNKTACEEARAESRTAVEG